MINAARILAAVFLAFAVLYWLAEGVVRRWLGLARLDNCATWAVRNFEYAQGDGLLIHKSLSGWFPHVAVLKGAGVEHRPALHLVEYVPLARVRRRWPPRKFVGKRKSTRLITF